MSRRQILAKQLKELKTLRQDMQSMYDSSQQEVVDARTEASDAKVEAARERERASTVHAENVGLRRWNETLSTELAALRDELSRGTAASADALGLADDADEAEALHLISAAHASPGSRARAQAPAATGLSVDVATLQQCQLEASATAVRLTHAHARLKRRGKEARASADRIVQLQETAQALSADLAAATAQIGKLEMRIRQQAETARQLEQLAAEHAALDSALERTTANLAHSKEEQAAIVNGPLAIADRRRAELEEMLRRSRGLLERKVRQAAEMAAAVQTLGADSRVRIEENVKLRLLAQRLGATSRELEMVRRSSMDEQASAGRGAGSLVSEAAERMALGTAWVPVLEGAPAYSPTGAPSSGAPWPEAGHAEASGSARRRAAWKPPGAAMHTASRAEALQSQNALQEKLKKVRNTFNDIRRQVGYDD